MLVDELPRGQRTERADGAVEQVEHAGRAVQHDQPHPAHRIHTTEREADDDVWLEIWHAPPWFAVDLPRR